MAWQRWSMVVVLGSLGCTRANPAFGDDDPVAGTADTGQASTHGNGSTDAPDTVADGPLDTATSFETNVSGTSGGDVTTSEDPPLDTGMDPSTGEPVCMTIFPKPWELQANPPLPLAGCTGVVAYPLTIVEVIGPNTIVGAHCNGCPCEVPGAEIAITFEVPLPPLPDCFFLHVQHGTDDMGVCSVAAYSMVAADETIHHVVSNVVNPEIPEPFEFSLAKAPWVECGETCSPLSGYYGLASGGTVVPPDGMPIAVPGLNGSQFEVVDISSGIDSECNEVARWHARIPG